MELAQGPYYRWSGKVNPAGAATAVLAGVASAAVLGGIYAYANLYIPIVGVVSAILAGGFGAIAGFVTASTLRSGAVRNKAVAYLVLAVVAFACLYVEWSVYMFAFLRRTGFENTQLAPFFKDPRLLWKSILLVNETGAWSFKGSTPTGVILWIAWGMEAAVIAGAAFFVGLVTWDAAPYCENCGTWCKAWQGVGTFAETDRMELRGRLEAHELGIFERLGHGTGGKFLRLDLAGCEKCGATYTLSVDSVVVTVKNGKTEVNNTTWVDRLLITQGEAEGLRLASARVAEAARAAATTSEAVVNIP